MYLTNYSDLADLTYFAFSVLFEGSKQVFCVRNRTTVYVFSFLLIVPAQHKAFSEPTMVSSARALRHRHEMN